MYNLKLLNSTTDHYRGGLSCLRCDCNLFDGDSSSHSILAKNTTEYIP